MFRLTSALALVTVLSGTNLGCSSDMPLPVHSTQETQEPSPRPDILFIVLDTVRSDRLGTYGGPHPSSPALTRLSKKGVLFEDATSVGSWTWPSHASLFTGEPPWVHGAHFASPADGAVKMGPDPFHASRMRDDLPTLADRLGSAGYQTHALSGNRLVSADFGLTRGFDSSRFFDTDEDVFSSTEGLLREVNDAPLLLFVNLYGAHAPLEIQSVPWLEGRPELKQETAPDWLKPFLRKESTRIQLMRSPTPGEPIGAFSYMRGDLQIPPEGLELIADVYDGELRAVDYFMGQIIEAWRLQRGEEGIIVVTSDHGEMLGERQLLEHGRTVSHELIEVPLVVSAPGRWPSGIRVSEPVQPHAIVQSLLHFAGLEEEKGDLDRAINGETSPPIQAAAWRDHFWAKEGGERFDQGYRFYREGDEAVIYGTRTGLEYYRLDTDPDLLHDRASEFPESAAALQAKGETAFPEGPLTEQVSTPEQAIDQLRTLGYIESSDPEE